MASDRQPVFLAVKRPPVQYIVDKETGTISASLSGGGTATVVGEQSALLDVTLVASAISQDDQTVAAQNPDGVDVTMATGKSVRLHLIEHEREVMENVQYVFQGDFQWRLLNAGWDTWTTPTFDDETAESWRNFLTFTDAYAQELAERSKDVTDPIFLLHDHQMICLPSLVRDARPDSRILLFVHVPWPAADYWQIIPRYMRTAILDRMLGADVVGFFCTQWVKNFLSCVDSWVPGADVDMSKQEIRIDGRSVRVEAMPLGASTHALKEKHFELDSDLVEWAQGAPLVVHSGRTDPIKNAARGVQAFAMAVRENEDLRQAKMLVRTNPNRLEVEHNQRYMAWLRETIDAANGELGRDAVRLVFENDVDATMASYEMADVLLFNSTIDGQNLSVYEGILVNNKDAPVILSDRCGAAETLADVCQIVNPFDVREQADALRDAMLMERSTRKAEAEKRRVVAGSYTLENWVNLQLRSLGCLPV